MRRTLPLVAIALVYAVVATAQPAPVTPDIFEKARALAEAAKAKHPTSPTKAADEFEKTFERAFGKTGGLDAVYPETSNILVVLMTPLYQARVQLQSNLTSLEAISDQFKGASDSVILAISPKTINAPNFTNVAVFSGTTPVDTRNELSPQEFTTRMGAKAQLTAGRVHIPTQAFQNAPVKIVLVRDGGGTPWEWTFREKDIAKLR